MISRNRRYISIWLTIFVVLFFGIAYLTFYFTKGNFPNPGLRNQSYSKANLTLVLNEKIDKVIESYCVNFTNNNENIYVTLKGDVEEEIKIFGHCDNKEIENGTMSKNDSGMFEYKFCFDYFNINSVTIKFNNKCLINELLVYYIK